MMNVRVLIAAACLALAGCSTTPERALPPVGEVQYRIGVGDEIALAVFREDALSGTFQVNESGIMSLPLVGDIVAAGKTVPELRTDLTALLGAEFVRDPNVTVSVVSYRPVYILGEVARPGQYDFSDNMTVYALVAQAGGFTYRADESMVLIRHEDEADETAYRLTPNGAVLPGDTIRFVERYF